MKINRKEVYQKFNGKCAYCGCEIKDESGKYMQVDHIISQSNFIFYVNNKYKVPDFLNHLDITNVNHIDNLFPACLRCNNYKNNLSLEAFRDFLKTTLHRLEKGNTNYRNALRFGMIEEKQWDGKFYFEKTNIKYWREK